MSKVALIFGIGGQDGSYLAELLLAKGYEVHGVVRVSSLPVESNSEYRLDAVQSSVTLHIGDVLDPVFILETVNSVRPDELYNLAGQSHVGRSFKIPLYTAAVNGAAVLEMLKVVHQATWPIRFYQASTSEMFGNAEGTTQDENTPLRPVSPYGEAKALAHNHVRDYRSRYGLHATAGILFNHESPRRSPEFVTRKVTSGVAQIYAKQRKGIHLGDLRAARDWGYAPDYVEAIHLVLQQDEPSDYVIATGESHSVQELCEYTFSLVGLDWEEHVTSDVALLRPKEIVTLRGSAGKANGQLGWWPKTMFHDLIKIMLNADLALAGVSERVE